MLRKLRRHWEQFGREDPFWAALTWKDKSDGRWSADDFFQNGEVVVGNLLDRAAELGIEISRERALDFGCGPGRLTQALATRFETVDGVDIARSMIANARRFNRHGDRCRYHVNRRGDLRRFGDATFTFVCSLLVLQHMKPGIARGYVREFMRVLAPSGVLVFQVPSYDVDSNSTEPAGPARQSVPRWPLEPSACRARIRPASDSLTGPAGELVPLRVEVENAGDGTWPCLGQSDGGLRVWLGGHLALPGDEFYWRLDAMRTALGRDLEPGQRVTLDAWITLPEENGDYLLELDMVQEHVCWFRQRGSEGAVVHCRVEGGRERAPVEGPRVPRSAHAPAPVPATAQSVSWPARAWQRWQFLTDRIQSRLASREAVMEMHGLARPDVQSLVTEAGGRLIEVDRQAQEHGYEDCHFWITRQ